MPSNADVVALQMERVRPKLQELFETSSLASADIKKGSESEQISTRDYRLPLVLANGGDYGTFDPDGGDMGRGSGMETAVFISTYFNTKIAFELTNLQMYATASSERAVAKVFARTLASAMKEYQVYDDFSWHTSGNGVFATATATATVSGSTVYTLDTKFATQLCRRKMMCHVYDTTLATDRGAFRILKVDELANKVTLGTAAGVAATVSGAASTDVLVFDGVSGATPAWKHGLYFHNSSAASGTYQNLNRANYPQIVSSNFSAASGSLGAAMGLFLLDQMVQRRDNLGNLRGYAHMKQRTAWHLLGIQISEWQRGKSDGMIDVVPTVGKDGQGDFTFAGIPHKIDKHQDRTRIDWIDVKLFGRAILKELDFYTVEGRKLFEIRGASGGVAASMVFYMTQHEDWYCVDPGALGSITSLAIPTA
jgi:hypothetical protein